MKGYLVKYSTGQYEDFFEHDVCVFLDKTKAETKVKEIDNEHMNPIRPEWSEDLWDEMHEHYWEELDNPTDLSKKYVALHDNRGMGDFDNELLFWKMHNQKLKEQDLLMEDIIAKYFPDWSIEKIREQIKIQESLDSMKYEEYGSAYIEEIEIVE